MMLREIKVIIFLILVACEFGPSLHTKMNFKSSSSSFNIKTGGQLILNSSISGINGIIGLPDNVAATVSGTTTSNFLVFANGILNTGTVSMVMTGTFDPTTTDTLTLYNGDSINVSSGTVLQAISVATSSTATILGQPKFSSSLSLAAASSVLQMGITTTLTQSVTGSGTLKLINSLNLSKGIALPSLVNLNNNTLEIQGGTYSSAVTYSGSGILDIQGLTTLGATWTIGSGSETYVINGNGNVLELGSSGQITFNGLELVLSNLVIKNLSASQINGTGEIKMSNVTLHLDANYTRSDGKFTVIGSNCKVITNGFTFTMSGTNNNLTINGAYLLYEQLNGTTTSPFTFASGAAISKLNGGDTLQVATISGGGGGGSYTPTAGLGGIAFSFDVNSVLDRNYTLTSSGACTFTNATTGTPKPMTLGGAGHYFDFPFSSATSVLLLQGNIQLVFSNIVFKNFYPAAISLASLSTITYGDGTRIELGPDLTIAAVDTAWAFNGDAEIDGNGATLTINKSQGITITGAKTLTLKNMRIITSTVDAFYCLTSTAKIKLQNVDLILTANFNFSQGNLDIADQVKISGDTGTSATSLNFEHSSAGTMTVTNSAELIIGSGINFKYNANPTGAANFNATKRKFVLARRGSKLTLNACSVQTTDTGLALDQGTLQIIDNVSIVTTANSYAQFEIANAVDINIASGAHLKLNGLALYNE